MKIWVSFFLLFCCSQAVNANPLIGEWEHDFEVTKKFYLNNPHVHKAYSSWDYALNCIKNSTEGIDVTFTEDKIKFLRDGRDVVSYKYSIDSIENGFIYITSQHFMGPKIKTIYKIDGDVLSCYHHRTKEWMAFRVYVKKK